MGITRGITKGSQSVNTTYLETIISEHVSKPPEGSWTIRDMRDMGMCRSTSRDKMRRGLEAGVLDCGIFRGKKFYWDKK